MRIQHSVPTVIINSPIFGDTFNKFIQDINQPCIILFDEFEKIYNGAREQEKMLTLLDGVFPTRKLFILTCNDKWRINFHMQNRPGRIFYLIEYKGLEESFIKEYCEAFIKNKTKLDEIVRFCSTYRNINFDMLKAIVEEVNRYPEESVYNLIKILNTKNDYETRSQYIIDYCKIDNQNVKFSKEHHFLTISRDAFNLSWQEPGEDEDHDWFEETIEPHCIVKFDNKSLTYTYEKIVSDINSSFYDKKIVVTLKAKKDTEFSFFKAIAYD